MSRYRVTYEGQFLTSLPLSLQDAYAIAIEENISAFKKGYLPLCEVVIAQEKTCVQCIHFHFTPPFEEYDGGCLAYMDHATSNDAIAEKCKAFVDPGIGIKISDDDARVVRRNS